TPAAGPCWSGPRRWRASSSRGCTGRSAACGRWPGQGGQVRKEAPAMSSWDPGLERPRMQSVRGAGVEVRVGDPGRRRPLGDADIFDLALKGKTAVIAAIEQDYEDRIHLAVTVDDDPGRDLGASGKPAHRFYFRPEELEPLGGAAGNGGPG